MEARTLDSTQWQRVGVQWSAVFLLKCVPSTAASWQRIFPGPQQSRRFLHSPVPSIYLTEPLDKWRSASSASPPSSMPNEHGGACW